MILPVQKERYLLIDSIRGVTIINMVAFHFLYDVAMFNGNSGQWHNKLPVFIWQQAICWTFILISGFVWQWGIKANLKRGLILNLLGILISLITWFFMPSEAIWFGILNFMGCAILLLIPFHKHLQKAHPIWGMGISFLLFLVFRNVQSGFLGIGGIELIELPQWLYSTKILTPLGFPYPGFASADYFPILPWIFLYLFGYFFCYMFKKNALWKKAALFNIPVLSAIGQKSIWIYLIHQPLSMLICMLLFG